MMIPSRRATGLVLALSCATAIASIARADEARGAAPDAHVIAASPTVGQAPAPPRALPPVGDPTVTTDGSATRKLEPRVMHELSPWSMFLAADVLVQAVMIGLMLASLMTWTILIGKTIELAVARRGLTRALRCLGGATTAVEARLALGAKGGLVAGLLAAAMDELETAPPGSTDASVKERGESRVADLVRAEGQTIRRGMGILATIGSTAPFVGLFGTVWGIMNSFIGISKAQTTNLAVVAPGIAEALLATAIGLVAAIPAVVIYNHFSRTSRSYQLLVNRAASAVARLLSRELDRRRYGGANRAVK